MRKIIACAAAVCTACFSVFASDAGMSVSASNVFKGKLLESISSNTSYNEEAKQSFIYNANSQLVKVIYDNDYSSYTYTFDYTGGKINGKAYDVKLISPDQEYEGTFYIVLGANNFASTVYQVTESAYDGVWRFQYDNEGHLIKMIRDYDEEEYYEVWLTYKNGDIVKGEDDEEVFHIANGNTENTSGIMLFDWTFGMDIDQMGMVYFAGLLGRPSKHLPTSLTYDEEGTSTFDWTVGSSGYPTRLLCIEPDGYYDDMTFTWTDNAGIEGVKADAATSETMYYNLQGMPVANPTSGLYIVKNPDGSSYKVFVK